MAFVDPRKTPFVKMKSRGELPHLYKPGGTYFVTFRLWDAVVPTRPLQYEADDDALLLVREYDPPISLGSCLLSNHQVASVVAGALPAAKDVRYRLHAWCVMPNHVHALFAPVEPFRFQQVMQSWKGGSSRTINQLLGRSGTFWERESFDHLIRTADSLARFASYIEHNPVVAGLCDSPATWKFGSRQLENQL